MYLVTANEMRQIDQYTIEAIGIPAPVLMENAGRAVAEEVLTYRKNLNQNTKPWLVLVGKGNNGADGIVAARHLIAAGVNTELLFAENPVKLTGDAALQRDIAYQFNIPSHIYKPGDIAWHQYEGVIDGLLGTGTRSAPKESYALLIEEVNQSKLPIISIDIPSGLNADTGQAYDPCIQAQLTVTLAFMKQGLAQYPGVALAGQVVVREIGIPLHLAERFNLNTLLMNELLLTQQLGVQWPFMRQPDTHKGSFGHVLVIAGSKKYSGAGLLTSKAALRTGAGLVTWALPESLLAPLMGHLPEAILVGVTDHGLGNWSKTNSQAIIALLEGKQVLSIGPGLDRFKGDTEWLQHIWDKASLPLVVDADALNIIADAKGLNHWPKRQQPTVLTPHPGELSRLLEKSVEEIQKNRIQVAKDFALSHALYLVLKGARTVIATPEGRVYINTTGNAGMATGGSGDVLTGMMAAYLAQGLDMEKAVLLSVFLHGAAGDRAAAQRTTSASLISGDIIEAL